MIDVIFPIGCDEITAPKLTQWDYGQKLNIYGLDLPQGTQIHFCDKSCEKAIARVISKVSGSGTTPDHWEVFIPDSLLETKWDVHAFIFINHYEEAPNVTAQSEGIYYARSGNEGNYTYTEVTLPDDYAEGTTYCRICGKTTKKITIPIIPRTQPDETSPEENEAIEDFLAGALTLLNEKSEDIGKLFNANDEHAYNVWVGTKEEYEAITSPDVNTTIYLFEDNKQLFDLVYPVGSIYMSVNSVNPGTLFTGTTWVAWGAGRVPLGVDTSDTNYDDAGKTGGAESTALTEDQLPSHTHYTVWRSQGNGYVAAGMAEDVTGPIHFKQMLTSRTHVILGSSNEQDEPQISHAYQLSTGEAGRANPDPVSHMQPYITCYMWKRTA